MYSLLDAQFWLAPFTAHEEREKRRNWFFRRPAVHHGFQRSWRANGLSRRVVGRVSQIAAEAATNGQCLRVITTGAAKEWGPVATSFLRCPCRWFGGIAADSFVALPLDAQVQSRCCFWPLTPDHDLILTAAAGHSLGGALATLAAYDITKGCQNVAVACYTYGAPRTGNHAFAR